MIIDVKSTIDQVISKRWIAVKDKVLKQATSRALNKVAALAKTQAAREIKAAGYNIKVGAIKKQLTIKKAYGGELQAYLKAQGRPIPLINYGARQTATGVSVSVKGSRKVIKGAFIATMPSGHKGVYVRVGAGHKRIIKNGKVMWTGLPIKQLFGPSIPKAFGNEVVQRALSEMIQAKFPEVFAHELSFALR
jgi:hypothetical protein